MSKRSRRRRAKKRKLIGKPIDIEESWEKAPLTDKKPSLFRRSIGLLIVAGIMAGAVWSGIRATNRKAAPAGDPADAMRERIRKGLDSAEEVANAFLAESDPAKRLVLARNPDEVADHLEQYPEQALTETPVAVRFMGHKVEAGAEKTAFAVEFEGGEFRLLTVLKTEDGLRVDWDAYARFCTASWEDLLSGKAAKAGVRVFVSPGDYFNEPFSNDKEWTCFRLMSPDLPHDVFAYARVASVRERGLKGVVLRVPNFRQHMTLRISGREGVRGERLFEIERVLAVGWVLGESDVEDEWRADATPAG